MERLVVLSDLWGKTKNDWWVNYQPFLAPAIQIQFIDIAEWAEIPEDILSKKKRHAYFMQGGIEKVVKRMQDELNTPVTIFAVSMGGTIAWKYGQKTGLLKHLIAVSATRLRYETNKPNGKIELYYGAKDQYLPSKDWFQSMKILQNFVGHANHQLYAQKEFAKILSKRLNLIVNN